MNTSNQYPSVASTTNTEEPNTKGGCLVAHTTRGTNNKDWWPTRLNIDLLHQHAVAGNPLGAEFDYATAFATLDLNEIKQDIVSLLHTSQDWWPADYGHYGPLMIRLAWHSSGTYRTADGRGGNATGSQRFAPLNSWPDNANLDKARLLLWPIKQQYGQAISWADLIVLAGNCALEDMGFQTLPFAAGRLDVWKSEEDIYWGRETTWLANERYTGDRQLELPLAAVQMGLIYVNPEGPDGHPDPLASARDIRDTFARMGMNDEETVALIAGGHTFGKCHGAANGEHLGHAPEAAALEHQAKGWANRHKSGVGIDTITTGIEGPWTPNPVQWDMGFFDMLLGYEWSLKKGPGGAWQWYPENLGEEDFAPAVDGSGTQSIIMTTGDMALRVDQVYHKIAQRLHQDPILFADTFGRAWFKLTHRDMGPSSRYLGPQIPAEFFIWQDPVPPVDHPLVDEADCQLLKQMVIASGLSVRQLVLTAWASASTYRDSDKRGGANGAHLRLAPQKDWEVNQPETLKEILTTLNDIREQFNVDQQDNKRISLADLIVLGGVAAIEQAAAAAGHIISVPFIAGRTDASQQQTDIEGMELLRPIADGFRNYREKEYVMSAEEMLIDRAQLLGLSAPEMTVLVGGMRVLGANFDGSIHGVFTDRPGQLTNDYFINLLDLSTQWQPIDGSEQYYSGSDRKTGEVRWTGTRVDLVFGSNSQLRALAETYACADSEPAFQHAFVAAWHKVMMADRFEL